jgi:hypothetical protein
VLVAGPCRARAERVVAALGGQSARARMEIVVVDLASERPLAVPPGVGVRVVARPGLERWGEARLAGVHAARAPVVAFVEDHCVPAPDWAERLLDAHRGPWAGVGYAFTNANPETYVSRAALLARYGVFVHPARRGPARAVSGSNVSYKREALLELGTALGSLLDIDFVLQQELLRRGHALYVEPDALAAHENYPSLGDECRAGRAYCRVLAAHRARAWPRARRLAYGVLAPLGAPALRLLRLAASVRSRPTLWPGFAAGLPAIAAMYLSDGLGEAAGYLRGPAGAHRALLHFELERARSPE